MRVFDVEVIKEAVARRMTPDRPYPRAVTSVFMAMDEPPPRIGHELYREHGTFWRVCSMRDDESGYARKRAPEGTRALSLVLELPHDELAPKVGDELFAYPASEVP